MANHKRKSPRIAVPISEKEWAALLAGEVEAFTIHELEAHSKIRSKATIYDLVRQGLLPKPRKIGGCSRWLMPKAAAA